MRVEDVNTKKELGQHWLSDASILENIVQAGDVKSGDNVLEIGPGLGTLTKILSKYGAEITALEYDSELIPKLKKDFGSNSNVEIVRGDIRKFDFSTMKKNYKIIANIPYYLTSHLIRSISETSNPPVISVLLIQKEVAQRLCANPGQMSILAVTAQFYFECSLDIEVPAKFFNPEPSVDSQVVVLKRRTEHLFDLNSKEFFKLVKAGFSNKRKTLRNSLSGGLRLTKIEVEKLLKNSNIEANVRAQELSLDDWYVLYQEYNKIYES